MCMKLLQGKKTKVSVIQFVIKSNAKQENLNVAVELIYKSIDNGANLICLPQAFATGVDFPSIKRDAESESGFIVSTIKEIAKSNGVYICGGFLEKDGKDIYDSSFLIDKNGELLGKYRRCFMWTGEWDFILQGEPGHVIKTEYGNIGLIIGYDLWFPLSFINYFIEQTQIIICMGMFFSNHGYNVKSICRARAAENICYFILASGIGTHSYLNVPFIGRSMVIDGTNLSIDNAEGTDILCCAGTKEEIIHADLYHHKIEKIQRKEETPYFKDFEKNIKTLKKGISIFDSEL